ncbi:hypothetical protein D3C84_1248610 [compost metagenome]
MCESRAIFPIGPDFGRSLVTILGDEQWGDGINLRLAECGAQLVNTTVSTTSTPAAMRGRLIPTGLPLIG